MFYQELNGKMVDLHDLESLTFIAFGHFTSMQVRNNQIKGLHLHIERLQKSSKTLFGTDLSSEKIREYLSHIIKVDYPNASIRVSIFIKNLNFKKTRENDLQVLITLSNPINHVNSSLTVTTKKYERLNPEIKHLGIAMGLLTFKREAQIKNFDDILYIDNDGNISEGSTWNIGFYDGEKIILPNTPALPGITIKLIEKQLKILGWKIEEKAIHISDVAQFKSCFIFNSTMIGRPISRINDIKFKLNQNLSDHFKKAYQEVIYETIKGANHNI